MDLSELQKNPEQIKALISMLQTLLPNTQQEKSIPIDDAKHEESSIKTRRRNTFTGHTNKFLDMPEKDMHKEDSAIDKKLAQSVPVARGREYTPVKVTCRVCGRTDIVNPAIVHDLRENRYKCNTCSTSSG
jgi:hypothetical protein